MKRLTMNRLAFSGIRANKKDYLLLGISGFPRYWEPLP